MYGVNVLIYVSTNDRLRDAYRRFNRDFRRGETNGFNLITACPAKISDQENFSNNIWWIEMQNLSE